MDFPIHKRKRVDRGLVSVLKWKMGASSAMNSKYSKCNGYIDGQNKPEGDTMKKTVEELREIVRNIRSGAPVQGFTLNGNILEDTENKVSYRVSGTFRIILEEVGKEGTSVPPPQNTTPNTVPPAHTEAMEKKTKEKAPKKAKPKSDRPRDENGKIITTEKRTCTKCGKEFEVSIYTKRDECYECKPKSNFTIKKSDRPRDENGKVITVEKRKCEKCGKEFEISIYASRKECYECSPVKAKIKAQRDPEGNVIKTVTVKCDKCGKEFVRSIYNPYQTSCPECREHKGKSAKPKAEDVVKICDKCGKEFKISKFATPEQKAQITCKLCRDKIKRQKAKETAAAQTA
jgi:DNA-directed RNA polymerase subunit RPC12/RpoP